MALVWLGLVIAAAAVVWAVVTRLFQPERLGQRLILPAVLIERICDDALAELTAGQAEVYVSPFAAACCSLTKVRSSDVVALGIDAARSHEQLVRCLGHWERTAGARRPVRAVRPVLQQAKAAAHGLLGSLPPADVGRVLAQAERELLVGVVAAPPAEGTLLQ